MRLDLSDEARAQAHEIDAWWRENRPAAPELFTNELADALTKLEQKPNLGTPYEAATKKVRRLLLRHTHFHLYFVEQAEGLFVVAVWSAYRGRGPTL